MQGHFTLFGGRVSTTGEDVPSRVLSFSQCTAIAITNHISDPQFAPNSQVHWHKYLKFLSVQTKISSAMADLRTNKVTILFENVRENRYVRSGTPVQLCLAQVLNANFLRELRYRLSYLRLFLTSPECLSIYRVPGKYQCSLTHCDGSR
jgi:hypothetical protein